MNKKVIYWGLGTLAVAVGGYYAYKKFFKKDSKNILKATKKGDIPTDKTSSTSVPFYPTPTGEAPTSSIPFPFLVPDRPVNP